jgi:hypothetical protein
MIAKGKSLTLYEPGHQIPKPHRVQLEQVYSTIESVPGYRCDMSGTTSPPPDARTVAARWRPAAYGDSQMEFPLAATDKDGISGSPTKVPPDTGSRLMIVSIYAYPGVVHSITDYLIGRYIFTLFDRFNQSTNFFLNLLLYMLTMILGLRIQAIVVRLMEQFGRRTVDGDYLHSENDVTTLQPGYNKGAARAWRNVKGVTIAFT